MMPTLYIVKDDTIVMPRNDGHNEWKPIEMPIEKYDKYNKATRKIEEEGPVWTFHVNDTTICIREGMVPVFESSDMGLTRIRVGREYVEAQVFPDQAEKIKSLVKDSGKGPHEVTLTGCVMDWNTWFEKMPFEVCLAYKPITNNDLSAFAYTLELRFTETPENRTGLCGDKYVIGGTYIPWSVTANDIAHTTQGAMTDLRNDVERLWPILRKIPGAPRNSSEALADIYSRAKPYSEDAVLRPKYWQYY